MKASTLSSKNGSAASECSSVPIPYCLGVHCCVLQDYFSSQYLKRQSKAWLTWLTCPSYWFLTECQEELPASLPLSQFKTNSLPTKVRAHGVITLGKLSSLCLYVCLLRVSFSSVSETLFTMGHKMIALTSIHFCWLITH